MMTKTSLLLAALCLTQVLAAPKPIDWKQLGRKALDVGRQALPVVKNGCQLLGGTPPPPQIYYLSPPAYPYQYGPPRGYQQYPQVQYAQPQYSPSQPKYNDVPNSLDEVD